MNLNERMNDAEFTIKIPICKYCRNREGQKECKVMGEVNADLLFCKINTCEKFIVDEEEKKIYEKMI